MTGSVRKKPELVIEIANIYVYLNGKPTRQSFTWGGRGVGGWGGVPLFRVNTLESRQLTVYTCHCIV